MNCTEANECPHYVAMGEIEGTLIHSNSGEDLIKTVFAFGNILERNCIDIEAFVVALDQDPELKSYVDENVFFPGIEELDDTIADLLLDLFPGFESVDAEDNAGIHGFRGQRVVLALYLAYWMRKGIRGIEQDVGLSPIHV